jgi:outer membrane protein assembly factor BamA
MASAGAVRDRGAASTAGFFVLSVCAAIYCSSVPATADDSVRAGAVPSFAELEAAGAVIGEVRINAQNIFDLDDPKENNWLFRLANRLHIQTRPGVIRDSLLFRSGERVSRRVIEESERVLRASSYLYDVNIQPVAYRDGIVDIEVHTRDTWTLQPGVSFSRSGGSNSTGVTVKEQNLFGTGVSVGIASSSTVDRSGTEFEVTHNQLFDGRTAFSLKRADYGDGSNHSVSLVRPFYALDTRWALGASAGQFDQIDSIYSNGAVVGQYRHRQSSGGVFGGWSNGLVDGWVQRYSVGVNYSDDSYEIDPSQVPPAQLPPDQKLAYPFIRYEVIEDKYVKLRNRNKIGRPEFFAMGLNASVQVGRASTGFGSTRDLWLYSSGISRGFESVSGGDLLTSLTFSGQYGDGRGERQFVGVTTQYFLPQGDHALFYAATFLDAVRNPGPADQLLLGGDNGLRGYPLRYQSGNQRALFTVEERFYTDWYPFRLIRVGGAAFFDVGRAWGGAFQNLANSGWLGDFGFGLRLVSDRSAFGNVVHLDVAFPINSSADIKKVQYLVKTKSTF